MKEQDSGLLRVLGPLVGEANRLYGYDQDGVSVVLNRVEGKASKVSGTSVRRANTGATIMLSSWLPLRSHGRMQMEACASLGFIPSRRELF